MTRSRTKINAVFLSALMVLSAVAVGAAFATPAAAQSSPVQEDSVELGGSTVTINTGGAGAVGVDDLPSDVSVSGISDGGAQPPSNSDGIVWNSAAGLPSTVSFTLTPDSSYSAGDSISFTVDGTSVTLTAESSGPSYTLDGGAADQGQSFAGYSGTADDLKGSIAWQGQDITVSGGLTNGEIQLRERVDAESTRLAAQLTVSGNQVTFDTEDRTPGDYYLTTGSLSTNSDGIPEASETFEIAEQSLTAEFDADSLTLEGPNSDDSDFEFDSNRNDYQINVTTASGDLAAEDLADIFVTNSDFTLDTSNVNEDDDEIVLSAVSDADDYVVDMEPSEIDAGDYEFVFSGTDSTAEDTDTLTVTESNQDAEFTSNIDEVAAGDVASFNLSLIDTSDAYVQIGGDDSNFVETLYIEEDDNAPMEIQINTRLLGTSAVEQAVYDTDNVETLHSANHPDASTGDKLDDVLAGLSSGDNLGGVGPSDLSLYEDDGAPFTNDIDGYVDAIGIADDAANQLSRPVQPTDYSVSVAGSNNVDDALFDADPGGEANNQLGAATMQLTQPEISGVATHTAVEEAADDEADVEELLNTVTAREEIALDDRLVVQFEATGIFGALVANSTGNADTSDFDRLTDDGMSTQVLDEYLNGNGGEDAVTVEVVADEDIGNQDPLEIDLTASDSDTYMVLDQANDQFFLIADTSSDDAFANGDAPDEEQDFTATIEYDGDDADDRYEFNPEAGQRNNHPAPFDSDEFNFPYLQQGDVIESSADLTLAPRSITFDNVNDDDQIEAPASESAEVSGTTNVAPGSSVELRAESTDASSSFRQGNDVNISEDGSITTTFDFSDQEVGDAFDTNFRAEGSAVTSVDSVIVESTGEEEPETNETEPEPEPEPEPEDDGETNESADDGESESTDDGTPGFGAVVALVALIGAALLAVRRQN